MWNSPTTSGLARAQHLDDFAIRPPVRFDARDPHHHPVAMHGLGGRIRRYEDVAVETLDGVIGNEKAVTFPVHVEAADGEFAAARGDGEVAGAQLDQVAARRQAGQRGFQAGTLAALRTQLANELLESWPWHAAGWRCGPKGRRPSLFDFTYNACGGMLVNIGG